MNLRKLRMSETLDWWRLRVKHESLPPAEAAGFLLSLGAQGAEEAGFESSSSHDSVSLDGTSSDSKNVHQFSPPLNSTTSHPDHITSFWEARDFVSPGALVTLLEESGFTLLEFGIVNEENWVQSCLDHFEQLQIGALRIVPIASSDDVVGKVRNQNDLWLIPGAGWGTGHHPSTSLSLQLLQSPEFVNHSTFTPDQKIKVLDMGTGSGILSMAAIELYPGSSIDAIDIDERALLNATENLKLNGCLAKVSLSAQLDSDCPDKYEVILANIYAEVLVVLEPQLRAVAKPGCLTILSGIIQPMLDLVKNAFTTNHWEQLSFAQQDEWVTLLLRRLN